MKERHRFLDALRFLTIIPCPPSPEGIASDWMVRSMKYFPVVGILIGSASAVVLLLASELWGSTISALFAVVTSVVATGALHEDGLADTADAFGGGWTVEKRLEIMKDSRIGTYGGLALGLGVALRVTALAELPTWIGALALLAAHAAARMTPILVLSTMTYAGEIGAMKVNYSHSRPKFSEAGVALGAVTLAILPLAFHHLRPALSGLLCGAVIAALLARWSKRLIGGYTGDALGAIEQVFEIGFLLGVTAAVR